jgi:hypothetical protein
VVLSPVRGVISPAAAGGRAGPELGGAGLFTWITYHGVTTGAMVQKCFTFAKVAGALIIIAAAASSLKAAAASSLKKARRCRRASRSSEFVSRP